MTTWVLLRGLAREARHWGAFPTLLRSMVSTEDEVIALDLPGNGSLWQEESPDSVAGMVAAARRELALERHRPPCVLVALSLGGMVALQWAAADRAVSACVLVNSSVGRFSPFWQRLRPRSYPALLSLLAPGQGALRREVRILRLTSNAAPDRDLAALWAAHAESRPTSRRNILRQLRAASRFRWPGGAPAVPTLLLAARRDRLVDVACSRAMAARWGLSLREHPTAGHDLPLDDPQWVAAEIAGWHALLTRHTSTNERRESP